ncbi:ROK family protein [Streptomyces sp. NPDC087851]|uniref:ROK family transcriptional regulator n=1 Tax=Streptomyces sp. NPDC087851 TaxID=3365810 RepID=UPI003823576C
MPAASWAPLSPAERAVAIEVLTHGPVSRSEIARKLNLSAGSLTRLTKPLIESGLLVEDPAPAVAPASFPLPVQGPGQGPGPAPAAAPAFPAVKVPPPDARIPAPATRQGRPSQPLDIVADSRFFAGFKITEDTVYGVVTTLKSDVVAARALPLPTREPADVAGLLHAMTTDFAADFPRLAGIGVGLGGYVVGPDRTVTSPFLGWDGVPFVDLLEQRTDLPVVVENDVAALVESEAWFGAGRGLDRFVVLTIGAGVGYGLVIGGQLVRSGDDIRGIGRRWIVNPNGPLTPDGDRGSATALLSIPSIRHQVAAATGRNHTYDEILTLAAAGDPMATRVIDEAARALGTVVAQIANFAMPQKILLAGEGVGLVEVANPAINEAITANRHPLAEPVALETKISDFNDWARGAAVLAIKILVLGRPKPPQ